MADRIINLGATHRIRVDDAANKYYIEFYNSTTAAWEVVEQISTVNKLIEILETITQDVTIKKDTPALRLTGTESGAKDISIRENAGLIEMYDEAAAKLVRNLSYTSNLTDLNLGVTWIIPAGIVAYMMIPHNEAITVEDDGEVDGEMVLFEA